MCQVYFPSLPSPPPPPRVSGILPLPPVPPPPPPPVCQVYFPSSRRPVCQVYFPSLPSPRVSGILPLPPVAPCVRHTSPPPPVAPCVRYSSPPSRPPTSWNLSARYYVSGDQSASNILITIQQKVRPRLRFSVSCSRLYKYCLQPVVCVSHS